MQLRHLGSQRSPPAGKLEALLLTDRRLKPLQCQQTSYFINDNYENTKMSHGNNVHDFLESCVRGGFLLQSP